jgi:hypothetical protein
VSYSLSVQQFVPLPHRTPPVPLCFVSLLSVCFPGSRGSFSPHRGHRALAGSKGGTYRLAHTHALHCTAVQLRWGNRPTMRVRLSPFRVAPCREPDSSSPPRSFCHGNVVLLQSVHWTEKCLSRCLLPREPCADAWASLPSSARPTLRCGAASVRSLRVKRSRARFAHRRACASPEFPP